MKLKTYQAQTMADALAAVRKDLGADAMILHTRSFRVGSWFGFGGKQMVEITASGTAKHTPDHRQSDHGQRDPRHAAPRQPAAKPQRAAPQRDEASDRELVLGGEAAQSRNARRAELKAARTRVPDSGSESHRQSAPSPAEIVVQRASSIVEPKPILTTDTARQGEPDQVIPSVPVRHAVLNGPRSGIATRLPRREGSPPVRLADASRGTGAPTPTHAEGDANGHARRIDGRVDGRTDGRLGGGGAAARTDRTVDPRSEVEAKPTNKPTNQATNKPTTDPNQRDARGEPQSASDPAADALRERLAGLEAMMGRVLETTRRTSLAVNRQGTVDEPVAPGPLLDLTNQLVENDAPIADVDQLVGRVRDRLDRQELGDQVVVRQALLREIEGTIRTKGDSLLAISGSTATGAPRVIALVGPTGVGKTTTVAKLAAACKLRHGKRVGLITSDTYRIAAVEQLRTYAGIIGLPVKVVMSPEEMRDAVESLRSMDVIIVDTAGRSQHDGKRLEELKAFVAAADPDETHLVLSSTVGDTVARRTAEKFKPLGPDRAILTKLDEAVCTGHLLGMTERIGLPLSFVTTGQEVPDDIEPARADRLARVALDGPGVLFGANHGRA